jgi:hypothetical protein
MQDSGKRTNARLQKALAEPHKTEEILLAFRGELKRRTMCDTERTAHTALNDLLLRQFSLDQAERSGLPT